jgi:hypothetical protein
MAARLVLNYKQIDYKTEWVEYPNLAPYLKSLSVRLTMLHRAAR